MKVLANGQLVEYTDQGKGKVVVLLHGWGTNLHSFDDLAAALTKNFRVISLDFPGFGASSLPPSDWKIIDFARTVHAALKKLEVSNIHAVIGHSFGGRVIIKSISQKFLHPEKVVLIGAAGVKPPKSAKKTIYKVIAKTGKAVTSMPGLKSLRDGLRKRLYESAGSTDYLNAGQLQKIFLNTINEDLLPEVHTITQPTLLIWGALDNETPLSDARKMKAELKDSQLVIYEDAGHFVYQEKASDVLKELEKFL